MKLISWLPFMLLQMTMLLGCSTENPDSGEPPEKVSLQLKWQHSAQSAGFYFAKEEGFFAEENLQVTFEEGGPNIDQVEQIRSGQLQFAIIPAESLFLKNDASDPLVAIAVLMQRSPLVFAVKKNSEIMHPENFRGKTIAVGELTDGGFIEGIIQFNALMKLRGIDPISMTIVPYDWDFRGFIEGSVDITPTYMNSGAIKLKHLGVETELIWPGDYGLEYYADTLVTKATYIQEHPKTVARFLKAAMRGWQEAIAHPTRAVEYTLKYTREQNKTWQMDIMEAQTALIHTGTTPIGWMDRKIWNSMYELLQGEGLLKEQLTNVDSYIDTSFLEKVYPEFNE